MSVPDRFTCEDVFRRLDDYLDRQLDAREMRLVAEHLETCAVCTAEYRFESSVIVEVRAKLQRIDLPAGFRARVHARLAADERAH